LRTKTGVRITHEGLIDLALLVGTDFNDGVHGIGPKKALKLVQQHSRIENMPSALLSASVRAHVLPSPWPR
jgi:5'-3' exonuclease